MSKRKSTQYMYGAYHGRGGMYVCLEDEAVVLLPRGVYISRGGLGCPSTVFYR